MRQTRTFSMPRQRRISPHHLGARIALVVAIAGVPLGASTAQQSLAGDAVATLETPVETVPFADHFTEVVAPLGTDLADLALPGDAVDLGTFDPPLESERAGQPLGSGTASYYGRQFDGRRTASGEPFDMRAMTAAHRTLPFGSLVKVTNPRNGRSVTVRINDRGPFSRGRVIDVSRAAAEELGLVAAGHGTVELELLAS